MIVLMMVFSGFIPSMAALSEAQSAAEYLYGLGLFRGTGTDSEGNPVFELDRSPTRAEALVMLLRLMGMEQEALDSGFTHPFTDTSGWNEPYIAYAYNKGITKGVAADRFGADEKATASMFVTFVLRALGYTDSGDSPDFSYSGSVSFAAEIGLTSDGLLSDAGFTRGDVAVISKNALSQQMRFTGQTLYQYLADAGIIPPQEDKTTPDEEKATAYWNDDRTVLTVPVEFDAYRGKVITRQTLLEFFPEMVNVHYQMTSEDVFPRVYASDRYSTAELMYIEALISDMDYWRIGYITDEMVQLLPGKLMYLADSKGAILATCRVPDGDVDFQEVSFSTRVNIDGARLYSDYRKIADTVSQNWGKNVLELGEERYNPSGEEPSRRYVRFLKMNGRYVSDGWYCRTVDYWPGFGDRDPVAEAESVMGFVFFLSDKSLGYTDKDGTFIGVENQFLLEDLHLISVDDPEAPAGRGLWVYEHYESDRVIYFFTRDGVYLGQIYIPAG